MKNLLGKIAMGLIAFSVLGIVLVLCLMVGMGIWASFISGDWKIDDVTKTKWFFLCVLIALVAGVVFYQMIMKKAAQFHRNRWTDFQPQIWYKSTKEKDADSETSTTESNNPSEAD